MKLVANNFVPGMNIVKVDLEFTLNGQTVYNTLFFDHVGGVTAEILRDFGSYLVTWWGTNVAPLLSTNVVLSRIRMTDLTTANGIQIKYTTGLPVGGTVNVDGMPGNVAVALNFTTEHRGKSYSARNYVPGIPVTKVTNGLINTLTGTGLQTAYDILKVLTGDASGFTWVVASKIALKALRSALEVTPITDVNVKPDVASSKRRLIGHGR